MKIKKMFCLGLSLIMSVSSINSVFAEWKHYGGLMYTIGADDGEPYVDTETGDMLFFSKTKGTIEGMYESDTTDITFPAEIDGVKVVGIEHISGYGIDDYIPMSTLVNVIIPEGVTYIGEEAFYHSYEMKYIELPESITSIGAGAFSSCYSLISIELPSKITAIESKTFARDSELENINIPSGVTMIGELAFSWCTGLKTVTIPSSVTNIAEDAFDDCESLETIYCYKNSAADNISLYADSENVKIVYLDENVVTETTEAITETTTESAENIYTESEADLNFDTSSLDSIVDDESEL